MKRTTPTLRDQPPRLRKIATAAIGDRLAKVYRDCEWDEYRVKFYLNGTYQKGADYHTDAREDAIGTAIAWAKQPTQLDNVTFCKR